MWDLLRRDLINEKVDIWALACLLYRICYFRSAFDGESKLQILNGNYRIPDLPKYSSSVTDLIRDMLQASPDDRPDITQVWFRVNEQLPVNLQKSLPDGPPEMQSAGIHGGIAKAANRSPPMPQRSPPPPPSSGVGGGEGQLGAFWSTHHAKDPLRNVHNRSHVPEDAASKDFELTFSQKDIDHGMERQKASKPAANNLFQDEAFNTFVAEFDSNKLNSRVSSDKEGKEEALEAEIEMLKEQLKQVNSEKAEITLKFEKLSAICRSQRQEIQELKQTLAARTPSPNKYQASSRIQPSASPPQEKSDWSTPSPETKSWQAFADDNKSRQKPVSKGNSPQSVRTRNTHQQKQAAESTSNIDSWGFGSESFTAVPVASSKNSGSNTEVHLGGSKIMESKSATQPAGWAGF
ncbi:hypothetical protein OIU84_025759 [Salix udensis]|uniref:non-specific serine/threonine protein kinase n=1 Tax=Salix udensis TaxID=889485 RepID=A0AAD6PDF8_9ROSI|nr:hypothetical protein OIU84_025759 [Salix udensis]